MKTKHYYEEPMDWRQPIKSFTGRWYVKAYESGGQDLFVEAKLGLWNTSFLNSEFIWWETVGGVQECNTLETS